jgi:hypothetical protein
MVTSSEKLMVSTPLIIIESLAKPLALTGQADAYSDYFFFRMVVFIVHCLTEEGIASTLTVMY